MTTLAALATIVIGGALTVLSILAHIANLIEDRLNGD